MSNKTCITYWLPKLQDAGIPAPKTEFVKIGGWHSLCGLLDGETPPVAEELAKWIGEAAERLGYPAFLRTGLTSGKHNWENTCRLDAGANILRHIAEIVEFSECCSFIGLAYDVWIVREWITGKQVCICSRYGNMPVCFEFRCFVRDGEVLCVHPYWPDGAISDGVPVGNPDWKRDHDAIAAAADMEAVRSLASRAGVAVGGEWSVDLFWDDKNARWIVTDMAEAGNSYHMPGCEVEIVKRRSPSPPP